MVVRSFRDGFDREWEVRAISANAGNESERRRSYQPKPELAQGWLLFTWGTERRRLFPLPPGWFVATDEVLSRWVEDAMPVSTPDRRTGTS
jgi:hypothetical protein